LFGCLFFYEIAFYFSHRLMHHKLLYKYIHKQHHEWTSSVGIISMYCHPIEHLISNLGSVSLGLLVLGSPVPAFWLWGAVILTTTIVDHSNYHLPFFHSSEFHDFHHLKFNVNYGAYGWMDFLMGTDERFKDTVNAQRHRTLFSFKSARELFPDPVKKLT